MALFIELVPIIAFFIAYQLADLYIATATMMIVSILQIIISWLQKKPISTERWINVILWILFGSVALIFKNSHFIKWKATIGYGVVAAMWARAPYRNNITLLEEDFGNTLHLSRQTWAQLNNAWVVFFCIMGLLNLIVAYNTETKTWVYFKLFGFLGLFPLFIIGQAIYLFCFKKNQLDHERIHR